MANINGIAGGMASMADNASESLSARQAAGVI